MTTTTDRASRSRAWVRGTTALLCLTALGCSPEIVSTTPQYGFIQLSVSTTGGDPDLDGYLITIDGAPGVRLGKVSGMQSLSAPGGTRALELHDVAPNCTVGGTNPRQVSVVPGQVVSLSIEIVCVATGIAVTVRTEGPDSPASVRIAVDEQAPVVVPANGAQTIGYLTQGSHTLTVLKPEHCTVTGGDRLSVTIAASTVSGVAFSVTCVPATRREKIAFVDVPLSSGSVMSVEVIDADGSGAMRLGRGGAPTWSSDGRELVYSDAQCYVGRYYYSETSYCTGGLIIQDPEVGGVRRPTSGEFGLNPAWSPVRNEIVFDALQRNSSDFRLDRLDLERSAVATMSVFGVKSMTEASWSPDGERIAFVCTWPGPITITDLCVVNRDGTRFLRLTNDEAREGRPAWSPDGATLAFGRTAPGEIASVIVLLDLGSGKMTPLGGGSQPAWSPDGSRLVFAGSDGLFVMNADGANRKRLTTGRHYAPAWRPK